MNHLLPVILTKILEHLELTFTALFLALLIALPLGIYLARSKSPRFAAMIMRSVAMIQTIPGLALIALIVVVLALLRPYLHWPTTGVLPAIIVLVLYALLPILSNTYTGIKQVNSTMVEVAYAMGMRSMQVLFWVELPLSLPILMGGIRIALVWIIGMVTLTSLVGSGGLGDLIIQGLRTMQLGLVLAGTIPAALLAMILDWTLEKVGKWIMPAAE